MYRKATNLLLASLVVHHTALLTALAGGAAFVGVAPRSKAAAASRLVPISETCGPPGKLIETSVVREQRARANKVSHSSNC